MQGQGGGTAMWTVAVHWVHWPWGFPDGTGKGQLPPVFCLGPPCLSYKAMRRLLLMLDLEVPMIVQDVNQGQLLLVPCLGPLSKWYGGWELIEAVACLRGFKEL